MNMNEITKGMVVRVSSDLSITKRRWNLDPDGVMLGMRGRNFRVERLSGGVGIHEKGFTYTFCPEDIHIPEIVKKDQPPVMFDPKNICE